MFLKYVAFYVEELESTPVGPQKSPIPGQGRNGSEENATSYL